MSNMERFSIRVTAKALFRRKIFLKITTIVLLVAVLLLGAVYCLSFVADNVGNFTVYVPKGSDRALTLSNTADFSKMTTYLEAEVLPQMDNITESWLPEDLESADGSHNGDNYIAYTYYLKNAGVETVSYLAEIDIDSVTKGADEAVRVMVLKNGEKTVYAKPQKGTTEPEPDTIAFPGNTKAMSQQYDSFEPGEVDKYTVVIWLEGNDPECIDDIKGGQVRMSMHFSIVDA